MREILFRGKRVDDGTWKYGSYVEQYGSKQIYLKDGMDEDGLDRYHVNASTVGQYTGVTDRSGTKIFEGDILMCHNNPKDIYKVVLGEFNVIDTETFENVETVVGWHTEVIPTADPLSAVEPFNLTMPLNRFYIERGEMVVIGNIYDNPELLKGGDEK